MPPMLGTKIMAEGAILAIIWASWPAPEVMRFEASPRALAELLHQLHDPSVEGHRLEPRQPLDRDRDTLGVRQLLQVSGKGCFLRLEASFVGIAQVDGEDGTGRNDVDRVRLEAMQPTVATVGVFALRARSRRKVDDARAAWPASRRMDMGVVPAWLASPSMVTRCQEMPWRFSTAPSGTPSCSSTGPCSICSST